MIFSKHRTAGVLAIEQINLPCSFNVNGNILIGTLVLLLLSSDDRREFCQQFHFLPRFVHRYKSKYHFFLMLKTHLFNLSKGWPHDATLHAIVRTKAKEVESD